MRDVEKELEQMTRIFSETPGSAQTAHAIQTGIQKASHQRKIKRRFSCGTFLVIALILLALSSVKISPAFAAYLDRIPGMHPIIGLIEGDKGLEDAIRHHALQKINRSKTIDHTTLTINSMLADKNQIIFFYTLKNPEKKISGTLKKFSLINDRAEPVDGSAEFNDAGMGTDGKGKKHLIHARISITLSAAKLTNPMHLSLKTGEGTFMFAIPFNLNKIKKSEDFYAVHKTFSLQGQKITIQSVAIYPTRTAIRVAYDRQNSKQITALDDLQLFDQTGEAETRENGITATSLSPDQHIYYLQSNYFNKPRTIYLRLTSARAIDKRSRQVVIDIAKKKLLRKPADNRITLQSIKAVKDGETHRKILELRFAIKVPKKDSRSLYPIFASYYRDQSGKHEQKSSDGLEDLLGRTHYELVRLPDKPYKSPITLTLSDYPSRIKGNIKLKIK
ncbi:MAG: DUF4179 domain-containing protein [Sporolactobacillus sp.]